MRAALRWISLVTALVGASSCGSGEPCTGSVAEVGQGCPATFDGTETQLPACEPNTRPMSRMCGGLIDLAQTSGSGVECFYDSTTYALVGARAFGDVQICEGGFQKTAGRVFDAPCRETQWTVMRTCGANN